jgi:uncharacterized peroxidase-related enzyme
MKTINVPTREQVKPETQPIFDQLQKRLGKVPNLYASIGYSVNALKGFLEFEESLNHGLFTAKEREAIALAVSEVNGCTYCLAAHTVAAIKRGFTKDETLLIRSGDAGDDKLSAVIHLARSIAENRGEANDEALENFYAMGYNEAALIELIGLVAIRIFTNYVFAITNVPIDFPLAETLSRSSV